MAELQNGALEQTEEVHKEDIQSPGSVQGTLILKVL